MSIRSRPVIRIALLSLFAMMALWLPPSVTAQPADLSSDWDSLREEALALRSQGDLRRAIEILSSASLLAEPEALRRDAAGELGITLLQAHGYAQAQAPLSQAYDFFAGAKRARYAVFLGNLATARKRSIDANRYYDEAISLAGNDVEIRIVVNLNRLRSLREEERPAKIRAMSLELDALAESADSASYHLSLGNIARQSRVIDTAWHHLDAARRLADESKNIRLQVEIKNALAQLYEDQGRTRDALKLSQEGLALGRNIDRPMIADLLITLEWRQARLLNTSGRTHTALAAYLRAVELIESVRQDIPIDYEDGQSSFRATLEPIYLGYIDLLLRQTEGQIEQMRSAQLRSVVDTIELIKQAELQDFLGDRCAVEAVHGGSAGKLPPATAALYPLLLPDRLELLLETSSGIARRTVAIKARDIRLAASRFAAILRNGIDGHLPPAQQLYSWLIRPFDDVLAAEHISALVVIPDGVLRLIPIAALHDGEHFAIEKFAISTATGLSMTNSAPSAQRNMTTLIAGVAEPGAVVEKLTRTMTAQILDPDSAPEAVPVTRGLAATKQLRSIRPGKETIDQDSSAPAHRLREIAELKSRLALPGVKDEVTALSGMLNNVTLLDEHFTVERLRQEAESGSYQIVHIASHGVFGGSSETSFIMAHDDILTMDGLQALLKAERFQKNPIELLSLSACQTAEGNDRSPLGISGAAIKARAKSVLGTLWPVEDTAARKIMELLYGGIVSAHLSKTEALRQAQIALIRNPDTAHPFFWAPFALIGNWQ